MLITPSSASPIFGKLTFFVNHQHPPINNDRSNAKLWAETKYIGSWKRPKQNKMTYSRRLLSFTSYGKVSKTLEMSFTRLSEKKQCFHISIIFQAKSWYERASIKSNLWVYFHSQLLFSWNRVQKNNQLLFSEHETEWLGFFQHPLFWAS